MSIKELSKNFISLDYKIWRLSDSESGTDGKYDKYLNRSCHTFINIGIIDIN